MMDFAGGIGAREGDSSAEFGLGRAIEGAVKRAVQGAVKGAIEGGAINQLALPN